MIQEELNYIKDAFSQILDDIGGNPDWYEAAKAVASDLGTIEKQLEKRVTKLPSNMDEAAIDFADASKMEQLNVDTLREWSMRFVPDIRGAIESTAYHFWNLAINARKEE